MYELSLPEFKKFFSEMCSPVVSFDSANQPCEWQDPAVDMVMRFCSLEVFYQPDCIVLYGHERTPFMALRSIRSIQVDYSTSPSTVVLSITCSQIGNADDQRTYIFLVDQYQA